MLADTKSIDKLNTNFVEMVKVQNFFTSLCASGWISSNSVIGINNGRQRFKKSTFVSIGIASDVRYSWPLINVECLIAIIIQTDVSYPNQITWDCSVKVSGKMSSRSRNLCLITHPSFWKNPPKFIKGIKMVGPIANATGKFGQMQDMKIPEERGC